MKSKHVKRRRTRPKHPGPMFGPDAGYHRALWWRRWDDPHTTDAERKRMLLGKFHPDRQ